MKRNTTIVLFASIFAVAMGAFVMSGNSATSLMISTVPQTQEQFGMLGHVEYTVLDDVGNVKGYMQNDNVVVVAGKDCAAQSLFTDEAASVGECLTGSGSGVGNGAFTWIAIGNGTVANLADIGPSNNTLADTGNTVTGQDSTMDCGHADGGTGGFLAVRNATIEVGVDTTSAGTTTIVVIDTSDAVDGPFVFDANNATTVKDSGLLNIQPAGYIVDTGSNHCTTSFEADANDADGFGNLFSRQLLNDATGITVNDGDSLSVKWTITVQ